MWKAEESRCTAVSRRLQTPLLLLPPPPPPADPYLPPLSRVVVRSSNTVEESHSCSSSYQVFFLSSSTCSLCPDPADFRHLQVGAFFAPQWGVLTTSAEWAMLCNLQCAKFRLLCGFCFLVSSNVRHLLNIPSFNKAVKSVICWH